MIRARVAFYMAFFTALSLLAPLSSHADEEPERDRSDSGEILEAETIFVTDSVIRPAELYQDTPVETEVLTEEDIADLPATTPIEALDAIPGIRIQARVQGQQGAVSIDGLPPEYTELLVNGQRYSGENQEAADLGDLLFFDLEKIEILRGPQALRYTARAGGGVINFVTKPPPTDGWRVGATFAGGDQRRMRMGGSGAYGGPNWGASVIADYNRFGGFRDPFPGSTDPQDGIQLTFGEGSFQKKTDVYTTIAGRPSENSELVARFGYVKRNEGFAIDDGEIDSRAEQERFLANVETKVAVSDATELYAKVTIFHWTLDTTTGREFELRDDSERVQLGASTYVEWGDTTHLIEVGADLLANGINLDEGPVPDTIENPDFMIEDVARRYGQAGFFIVTESEFTENFSIEGGLRYEMNSQFKPELLPQMAILYTPYRFDAERAIKLRVSAGRAALYPSLRDLYQPPVPQGGGSYFLAGNSSLKQETTWAVRASVEANPKRWISGTVSGFFNEVDDSIRSSFQGRQVIVREAFRAADPIQCALFGVRCTDEIVPIRRNVFERSNLDRLRTWGAEARVEIRPWEWVELNLGYTWLQTDIKSDTLILDELPNSPRHIANGKLILRAKKIGTSLTVRASWRDRAFVEGTGTGLPSFTTTDKSRDSFDCDARINQDLEPLLGADIRLFFQGNNLNDNRVVDSYRVRGRSFVGGVEARWP
ncbi:MAG: TonB-dependent receptor [bacterium]|nr:TonB-dependent receptor [bacterium]